MLLFFYPRNQLKLFFLDLSVFAFLLFILLQAESELSYFIRLLAFILILFLYVITLNFKKWLHVLSSLLGILLFTFLAIQTTPNLLIYLFVFSDASGNVKITPYVLLTQIGLVLSYVTVSSISYGDPFAFLTTMFFPFLFLQLALPYVIRMIKRTQSLERDLAVVNKEIESLIKEEERNRIARDLHDTLGHTMAVIKFKSELAIRLMDQDSKRAKLEMKAVLEEIKGASKQVREVVSELKHIRIQDELQHGKSLFKGTYINYFITGQHSIPQLSEVTESMLALSIREALLNCYKHSRADRVHVHFSLKDATLTCEIKDDGVGMSQERDLDGTGIQSIQERMAFVNGRSEWNQHTIGNGVTITLFLPIIDKGGNAL